MTRHRLIQVAIAGTVTGLPTTGESPMWRDALLALGTSGTLYMRRQ